MDKTRMTRQEVFRGTVLAIALAALLLGILMYPLSAAQPTPSSEEGQALFQQLGCIACHSTTGEPLVGPTLKGLFGSERTLTSGGPVTADEVYLRESILDPNAKVVQGFPPAMPPNFGDRLSAEDLDAIVVYIKSLSAPEEVPVSQPGQAPTLAPGDPILGKNLFTGTTRFQNGGPSCMACHSITGIGALGGGALGPDLTQAFSTYGEDGIASVLANIPFPAMSFIFSEHPLTPEEQAHLRAFLQQAVVEERPTRAVGQLALLSVAGAVVLLGLAHLPWRRRLTEVRRSLIKER
ncbi:MAG: c-type cytochrome [Anaerolineae bacterium]